jgi:hypothetical protein
MNDSPVNLFSLTKLAAFQVCQRRYQLRYEKNLPWPMMPLGQQMETAIERGREFHQILERYFLKLLLAVGDIRDAELRVWWSRFERHPPILPDGQRLPEISLTVPVGEQLLTGRFDLLILGQKEASVYAQIFDWKTGKVQPAAELRQDWQTRLYLAMLTEGGGALVGKGLMTEAANLDPDLVSMTYWYVREPEEPVTIAYDRAWHQQNWAEIKGLITRISQKPDGEVWPLTDDWSHCRRCGYQSYCGRQEAGSAEPEISRFEDALAEETKLQIEPDLP